MCGGVNIAVDGVVNGWCGVDVVDVGYGASVVMCVVMRVGVGITVGVSVGVGAW